jgi:hypothetical protein
MITSLVWGARVGPSEETYLLALKSNNTGVFDNASRHRLVEEKTRIKFQPSFKILLPAE